MERSHALPSHGVSDRGSRSSVGRRFNHADVGRRNGVRAGEGRHQSESSELGAEYRAGIDRCQGVRKQEPPIERERLTADRDGDIGQVGPPLVQKEKCARENKPRDASCRPLGRVWPAEGSRKQALVEGVRPALPTLEYDVLNQHGRANESR